MWFRKRVHVQASGLIAKRRGYMHRFVKTLLVLPSSSVPAITFEALIEIEEIFLQCYT